MAVTLRALRQACAYALDDLTLVEVSSATTNTVVSPQLVNAVAQASDSTYGGNWVYVNSGAGIGQQRVVRPNGYAPSTGTLSVDAGWSTLPTNGAGLEITRLFPCVGLVQRADTDYRTLINRACDLLDVFDRIDIETAAGARTYTLANYAAWLDRPGRVLAVFDPPRAHGAPRMPTWRRWEVVFDAGAPFLQFEDSGYSVGGATFQVFVRRPARSLVNGADSGGLTNDADTVDARTEDVVTVFLMLAYEVLATRSTGRPSGPWQARFESQREMARALAMYDATRERPVAAPEGGASRAILRPTVGAA